MTSQRLTIVGVTALALGVLLLIAQSFAPGGGVTGVQAGLQSPVATSNPSTGTPITIVRTSTPKATATAIPSTATSVPPTTAPAPNTPAPSSGNEGVNVRPPNTGTGDNSGSGLSVWLLVLGAGFVVAGSGAVFAGARRR